MFYNKRSSGKTFRRILESLKLASEGKKIIIITNNHQQKDWTFRKVRDICNVFPLNDDVVIIRNQCDFPNSGRLIILTKNQLEKYNYSRQYRRIDETHD